MDHPNIIHEGKKYYKIGCRVCGDKLKNQVWEVFSDGDTFCAQCECGNKVIMKPKVLQRKPDSQAIPMRMIL